TISPGGTGGAGTPGGGAWFLSPQWKMRLARPLLPAALPAGSSTIVMSSPDSTAWSLWAVEPSVSRHVCTIRQRMFLPLSLTVTIRSAAVVTAGAAGALAADAAGSIGCPEDSGNEFGGVCAAASPAQAASTTRAPLACNRNQDMDWLLALRPRKSSPGRPAGLPDAPACAASRVAPGATVPPDLSAGLAACINMSLT